MASWTWQSQKAYRQAVPELSMRKEAWTRIKEAGSKLGLDPSSRSGLHVKPARTANPFDGFGDCEKPNKFAELGKRPA